MAPALAAPLVRRRPAAAQAVRKVGWLRPSPAGGAPARTSAFLEGLRAAGLRSPEEVELLDRVADGDPARLEPMARDLIDRNVDVIVASSPAAINTAVRVARAAGATVPIAALAFVTDLVASGLVQSLAQPGGNLTGLFLDFPEFSKKWLELLNEAIPHVAKVTVFWAERGDSSCGEGHSVLG